jgi:hypothetical protein
MIAFGFSGCVLTIRKIFLSVENYIMGGKMTSQKYWALGVMILALFFSTKQVNATMTLVGDQLFYNGGGLSIQNLPATSGFANYIYLDGQFLFIDNGNEEVTFTQTELSGFGIDPGEELVFVILPDSQLPAFFQAQQTGIPII